MKLSGVLKKEHVEIPGNQLKNKWNFQVMKKKSCGISMSLGISLLLKKIQLVL